MTLQAGIYGDSLTGVQLDSANAPWTAGGVTWNNQPGLTIIQGVTNPSGTFGSGAVTWTIPGYAIEKWATAGYNGIGLISAAGSTQHFYSLADANPANHPSLTLTAADGADGPGAVPAAIGPMVRTGLRRVSPRGSIAALPLMGAQPLPSPWMPPALWERFRFQMRTT